MSALDHELTIKMMELMSGGSGILEAVPSDEVSGLLLGCSVGLHFG